MTPTIEDYHAALGGHLTHDGKGKRVLRCPGPGHSKDDLSLSVWVDDDEPDGFGVLSFADGDQDIPALRDFVRSMVPGLGPFQPNARSNNGKDHDPVVAKYEYHDADGRPVLLVNRTKAKRFFQQRPDGHGGWVNGGIPKSALVAFRLVETIEGIGSGRVVFITEGEKGALSLIDRGFTATCSPGGAKKWPGHFKRWFDGATVIILPDNDKPGREHAAMVKANLEGVAAAVKIVSLPGLDPGQDVFDYLAKGGDPEAIADMPDADLAEPAPAPEPTPTFFHPWERHPLPSFPLECLSPLLRDFAVYQSRTLGADVNAIAMAMLAALSSAVDHRFSLRLRRNTIWRVNPRLWVLMIGASSSKKTPIQRAVTRHHYRIEHEASADHARAMAKWKADQDAGRESVKPPPSMRLVVNDATPEAVADILASQDRGVLVLQDELSGFLGSLDRYGGGGKGAAAGRGFYLQSYNGGPMHRDRVGGKGHQPIGNVSVSFLAGIQESFRGQLGGLMGDGLLQRFAIVAMAPATFPEDLWDEAGVELGYENLIRRLVKMPPRDLTLSDSAMAEADTLQRRLFMLETKLEGGEAFSAFIGKLHGLHGNLMLLLHLVEHPGDESANIISADTAKAAAQIILFILKQGADFYGRDMDGGDQDDLSKLAAHVLVGEADRYTVSDLAAGVPRLRGRPAAEIIAIASRLETLGWWEEGPARGGSIAWTLRPGLREALHQQRATKAAEAASAMQAYREALRG